MGRRGQVVDVYKFQTKEFVLSPAQQVLYAKLHLLRKINMATGC